MLNNKMEFHVDFFTNAIESNAYDIAFYLLKVYEDNIYRNADEAIISHITSYQKNNKFLKSKLHMSKMMINLFNFNSAK